MKKKVICLLLAAGIISSSFVVSASELPENEDKIIQDEVRESDTEQTDSLPSASGEATSDNLSSVIYTPDELEKTPETPDDVSAENDTQADTDNAPLQDGDVTIDEENFPDEIFRKYVQERIDNDGNGSLSEKELQQITSLDLSKKGLKDVKGIEYFSALTTLVCNDNQLTSLDISQNKELTSLNCNDNQLTSPDISQNKELTYLVCANNQLTTLEIGATANTKLNTLACPNNQLSYINAPIIINLKTLNVSNNRLSRLGLGQSLTSLYCDNNQLSNLDVYICKNLEVLYCSGNQLTALDISKNTALYSIQCANNQLSSIDISKNTVLESLFCWSNNISELDLSRNIPLKALLCSDNQISTLDLSTNINLERLKCSGNQLSSLDVNGKNALTTFECENNVVTADTRQIDMRSYDKSFDATKISNLQNLTLNGDILTLSEPALSGSYDYDCGKDLTMSVTIELDESGLAEPTATPSTMPTPTATSLPRPTPTTVPTAAPSAIPGSTPTSQPTVLPTFQPTATPTSKPDETPTLQPSAMPTTVPSATPTIKPFEDGTFSDVETRPGNWKYESIKYVYENGIMNGISGTTKFEPDETLNRAMFATVLYRMVGSPDVQFRNQFEDVGAGSYYSDAVIWAFDQGIVQGLDGGKRYGVNEPITREQIAKMLNRYGEVKQYPMTENADLNSFPDCKDVSGWATGYMEWAVGSGTISGRNINGTYYLDPKGNATRAKCSAMLMRFLERYK